VCFYGDNGAISSATLGYQKFHEDIGILEIKFHQF